MNYIDPTFNPSLILKTPSIGSILNKILAMHPDMTAPEAITLVRKAVRPRGKSAGDFAGVEVVDEKLALELAKTFRK